MIRYCKECWNIHTHPRSDSSIRQPGGGSGVGSVGGRRETRSMLWKSFLHPILLSWTKTTTIWGKCAVILFNAVVWFMILTSVYSVVAPSSEGTNCVLDELQDDDYTLAIFKGLIRVLNWFGVGFFVAIERQQVKFFNVSFLVLIMCGAWMNNQSMGKTALTMDPTRITQKCWDSVLQFNAVFAFVSVAIFLLVVLETLLAHYVYDGRSNNDAGRTTTSTEEEHRPLLVDPPQIKRSGFI